MAIFRFLRKARVTAPRRRRPALLLPDATNLSGTARRVNRVVAVVALFGAFGTVALAVALTPGAQTTASSATAPPEVVISRIEVPPAPVEDASAHTTVVAVQPPPQPAPKADRLVRTARVPDARKADDLPEPLHRAESDEAGGRDAAMADTAAEAPKAASEAVESAERKLEVDVSRDLEFGLSEPPAPAQSEDAVEDAAAEDIEAEVIEATADEEIDESGDEAADEAVDGALEEEVEEVVEDAVERAVPEKVAATRTAPVTTDVNMRARPQNGAPVILVVPGKSNVEVIGCDYWCEVVYEGKRGWIYKGFVRGS